MGRFKKRVQIVSGRRETVEELHKISWVCFPSNKTSELLIAGSREDTEGEGSLPLKLFPNCIENRV